MKTLFNIVYYLLSYDTREKLQMASGIDNIDRIFGGEKVQVPEEQAMPLIRKNGKLNEPIDLNRYLYDIPFHLSYTDK